MMIGLLLLGMVGTLFASTSEIVIYALPEARVETLSGQRRRGSAALAALRQSPIRLLVLIWLLRLTSVATTALAAWTLAAGALDPPTLGPPAAAGAAVLILVLIELLTRTLALHATERLSLLVSPPLWALSKAALPLLWPAESLVALLTPDAGERLPRITDRELRDLVNPGNGEPLIEEHERRLIQRTFLLDQTRAYDIMTPRVDIFAWSEDLTLAMITPELRAARYSRVPLYRENIDDITGILYVRDAYQALIAGQRDVELAALAREPFFVPGSVTLDVLLVDFQSRRIQMGIVIDEYGGVDGLVTLEDILEELVGEIEDESDVTEDHIVRLGRNEIVVHGGADLREINHFFNTTFPLLEHRSLNGYLLDELGRVPESGERIVRESVLIEVLEATDTQVVRARLSRQPPRSESGRPDVAAATTPGEPEEPDADSHPEEPESLEDGSGPRGDSGDADEDYANRDRIADSRGELPVSGSPDG